MAPITSVTSVSGEASKSDSKPTEQIAELLHQGQEAVVNVKLDPGELIMDYRLGVALTMQKIVDVHYPNIQQELLSAALRIFYEVRNMPGIKKKPSTSELIDWLKLLMADDIPLSVLQSKDQMNAPPPLQGALLKNEQDMRLFERLMIMNKNNR